jgi:hypothetical protein
MTPSYNSKGRSDIVITLDFIIFWVPSSQSVVSQTIACIIDRPQQAIYDTCKMSERQRMRNRPQKMIKSSYSNNNGDHLSKGAPMTTQIRYPFPIRYSGSLLWPALFALFFPSISLLLVMKNMCFIKNSSSFRLSYNGSWFWVFFWTIVFFPVGMVLFFFRGADVIETILP